MGDPVVHFEIIGKNGTRLQEFYRKQFGWDIQVVPQMNYGMVDTKGEGINGGVGEGDKPLVTFYIEVPDVQKKLDQVVKGGAKVVMPVQVIPGMVTMAQFADPEGNVVGLVKNEAPPRK